MQAHHEKSWILKHFFYSLTMKYKFFSLNIHIFIYIKKKNIFFPHHNLLLIWGLPKKYFFVIWKKKSKYVFFFFFFNYYITSLILFLFKYTFISFQLIPAEGATYGNDLISLNNIYPGIIGKTKLNILYIYSV